MNTIRHLMERVALLCLVSASMANARGSKKPRIERPVMENGIFAAPRSFFQSFHTACTEALDESDLDIHCVNSVEAVSCGAGGYVHMDLLREDNTLVNVVVKPRDADEASALGGFCLAPDVPLDELRPVGIWELWETRSTLSPAGGVGLHTKVAIPAGTCLGRLVRVYTPSYFNDWPIGARLNHAPIIPTAESQNTSANVDFIVVGEPSFGMVHLFGVTTRDIAAGEELFGDYQSRRSPRPNFLAENPFELFEQFAT